MDTEISQHKKLAQENKIIPPLLPGIEPLTFLTTELSPLPNATVFED